MGAGPQLTVETIAAWAFVRSGRSRPSAAEGGGAPAPALNRRSTRTTLQPPFRPLSFNTVAPHFPVLLLSGPWFASGPLPFCDAEKVGSSIRGHNSGCEQFIYANF